MGKWDRRYFPRRNRRSRYQDPNWSPPRESFPDPEFTVWQDNVPLWEKKFCYQSGVAWEKVLSRKTCNEWYTSVLDWDDLAGKEAFHLAKDIYWAKINNLPFDLCTPGPDLYIDKVDWNPHIDPKLARDLDRAFFLPDEDDTRSRGQVTNPKPIPTSSSGWEDIKKTIDNDYKATKWDPWGGAVDNDNPWERGNGQTSGSMKDKAAKWDPWEDGRDGANIAANNNNSWKTATRWDDGGAKKAANNNNPWNKAIGWDDGRAKKTANSDNPWKKATGWDDGGAKKATNNENPRKKATRWGDGAQRPATTWDPWNDGSDERAKKTTDNWDCPTANHNLWGNSGWSKAQSRQQNLSGTVKVSSHYYNSKTWKKCSNEWEDSRESLWGKIMHIESGNNRTTYHTGSNSQYQHGYSQKRRDRYDSNTMRWSQKGPGETYCGPRKREGSSQYWDGNRGSRLRYIDQQTSQSYEGWR